VARKEERIQRIAR
jgi:hypothetical protein